MAAVPRRSLPVTWRIQVSVHCPCRWRGRGTLNGRYEFRKQPEARQCGRNPSGNWLPARPAALPSLRQKFEEFWDFFASPKELPVSRTREGFNKPGNARKVKSVGIAYATHARSAEFYKFRHPNRSYQRFYGWCLSRQRGRGQFPHTCQAETLREFFSCREAQSAVHNNPTKTTTEK
jgi:hypothetical protein